MTHDEIKQLIAPYVLGAVSREEERAVRSHVMSCEECMEEAESYSGAAAALALAVDEEPLPKGFADAVVAKTETEGAPVRPRWWLTWAKPLAGVAAVALVATVVLGGAFLATRARLQHYEDAVAPLVQGDGMRLTGPEGAAARMVPTVQGATLFAAGLDEVPEGRTYQLWLMECDDPEVFETCDPVSAGTFDVSGGLAVLDTAADLGRFDRAAVTVEPEGGSSGPTTPPVIDSAA